MLFKNHKYTLVLRGTISEVDFLLPLWLTSLALPDEIILSPSTKKKELETFFNFFFGDIPRIITYDTDIDFKKFDYKERKLHKIIYHLIYSTRSIFTIFYRCFRKNVVVGWDMRPSNVGLKFAKDKFYIPTSIDATRQRYEFKDVSELENRRAHNGSLLIYSEFSDWTTKLIAQSGFKLVECEMPTANFMIQKYRENNLVEFNKVQQLEQPTFLLVLSAFNSINSRNELKKILEDYLRDLSCALTFSVTERICVRVFSHPRTDRQLISESISVLSHDFPNIDFAYDHSLIVQYLFANYNRSLIAIGGPTGARNWFQMLDIPYFVYIPEQLFSLNERIKLYERKYRELTSGSLGSTDLDSVSRWIASNL